MSKTNLADPFTKGVPKDQFDHFLKESGLITMKNQLYKLNLIKLDKGDRKVFTYNVITYKYYNNFVNYLIYKGSKVNSKEYTFWYIP